mmetsp:Transcript_9841/g.15754  ORF Transcript_9841/g.15754 Transcript_9841/m.15754 type:complete len:211 (-) Transcript_9841:153-785(-)
MADATVSPESDPELKEFFEPEESQETLQRRRKDLEHKTLSGNPLIPHHDPTSSEMVVTFPEEPCNDAACKQYIETMGGCDQICGRIYGEDHFSGERKFGVRRRSLISFWAKWGWSRTLFCTKGKPYKFMNCGCDCKYFDDMTPKRTYLAQYECWTCFGDGGKILKPAEIATMKQYNFDDLMDLNKRRGIKVHYLGPKRYDIRAPAISRPS